MNDGNAVKRASSEMAQAVYTCPAAWHSLPSSCTETLYVSPYPSSNIPLLGAGSRSWMKTSVPKLPSVTRLYAASTNTIYRPSEVIPKSQAVSWLASPLASVPDELTETRTMPALGEISTPRAKHEIKSVRKRIMRILQVREHRKRETRGFSKNPSTRNKFAGISGTHRAHGITT